jgi:hypothetical protein
LLLLALTSCRVSLVPAYSEDIAKQIENTAKFTDRLYLEINDAAPADRAYKNFAEKYRDIEVEINSLIMKNKMRPKGESLVTISKNLLDIFLRYKDMHKEKDTTISNGVLELNRKFLQDQWTALLAAERGLKIAN